MLKPTTAPTDRSIPAVIMTNVSPIARMEIIAPWRRRFGILIGCQKVFVVKASVTHKRARRISSVRLNRTAKRALRFVAAISSASEASTLMLFESVSYPLRVSDPNRLG